MTGLSLSIDALSLDTLSTASSLIVASASDGDWTAIGFLFFFAGFVFYGIMFLRYRNADKRYHHESRTRTQRNNLQARDDFVKSQKGLSNSKLRGANNTEVSGSLNSLSKLTGLAGGNLQNILGQVNRFTSDK